MANIEKYIEGRKSKGSNKNFRLQRIPDRRQSKSWGKVKAIIPVSSWTRIIGGRQPITKVASRNYLGHARDLFQPMGQIPEVRCTTVTELPESDFGKIMAIKMELEMISKRQNILLQELAGHLK